MNDSTQILNAKPSLSCKVRHIPLKRIFDIAFSSFVLILGSPLFLCIAVAIRLSSKGKSIYAHKRVGRAGRSFKCYKFRTMYMDADKKLNHILQTDAQLKKEWEENRKLKNDPRVTKLGAFLRKTSLDELPQFWNVLKGDLSVVGPRPVVQEEVVKHLGIKANKILSIRPGLTGIWQVSGRSDTSYSNRILMDEEYVDTQSLTLDIKLILKTIPSMIASRGAY
jgi:undecaprenyl-phosphate galactose phosphotransferase